MNEFQQYYAPQQLAPQQLMPQGFFGSLIGAPLGGLIGRGVGGLLGNQNLGHQIGQAAGGIGGAFLPFAADPVAAAYAQQAQQQQLQQLQQAQLAPQGWFGNIVSHIAPTLGTTIGGIAGNAGLGTTIGNMAGQLGRYLPFSADPVGAAYAQQAQLQQMQQAQLAPQGWFGNIVSHVAQPLGGMIGGAFGNAGLGNTIGGMAGQLGRYIPFSADPVSAAYAQQAAQAQQMQQLQQLQQQQQQQQQQLAQLAQQGQIAPQGWFGNLVSRVAQPLGGAIGGAFGNAGLGNTIGGVAGQLGRYLPFDVDPITAAYAQQQAQQQQLAQLAQQAQLAQAGQSAYGNQQTLH